MNGVRTTAIARRVTPMLVCAALAGAGCSLGGLVDSDEIPSGVSDPSITQTPEGALAAYHGTLSQFRHAFSDGGQGGGDSATSGPGEGGASVVAQTGLLSDELNRRGTDVDRRAMLEGDDDLVTENTYSALQKTRGQAGQAIGLLRRYVPDQPALAGHLYALQGYAEVFLAELFCSGIPLGTLDYDGDFTYRPGSSTAQVFTHAVALFDTALALAADSARLVDLARAGRARALLALGRYADAAAAVAAVSDDYQYTVLHNAIAVGSGTARSFAYRVGKERWVFTVTDREGVNGMDWRTSDDPRTQLRARTYLDGFVTKTNYHPAKYDTTGAGPVALASGIEARLIEAEAALQTGDAGTWLAKLNHLRQTAWPTIVPAVAGPLPDTTDPGTADGRVDLMFRERAFWLFLTGHRQGDLRRLIRHYGRPASAVYPTGAYPEGGSYGTHVTAPIPTSEFANPLYAGCASRGA